MSSSRSDQQSFVGEPGEVDSCVIGKLLAIDFLFFPSCQRAKKLHFAFRNLGEIGRELFLSEAAEDFIPVLCGTEFVAGVRESLILAADECHKVWVAGGLGVQPLSEVGAVCDGLENCLYIFNGLMDREWAEINFVVEAYSGLG